MRVLIAGLSEQSTTAVELLVASVFAGATVVKLARGQPLPGPKPAAALRRCDLCVVDLLGLGYGVWSPQVEAELHERVLGDQPAVLLAPSGAGGGWLGAPGGPARGSRRVLLQHPLTTAAMRQALNGLRAPAPEATKSSPVRAVAAAALAALRPARLRAAVDEDGGPVTVQEREDAADSRRVDRGFPSTQPPPLCQAPGFVATQPPKVGREPGFASTQPPYVHDKDFDDRDGGDTCQPAYAPRAGEQPAEVAGCQFGLSESALAALVAACPEAARNPYLNLVCGMVLERSPQEFQIGAQSGGVIFPAENWAASNISNAMRSRLMQHPMMLQIVKVRVMEEHEAFERASRLFGRRSDGRRPLDSFMWSLVYNTFAQSPPLATGDVRFRLERFPNFTRLPAVPGLFIQLALLSLREPQSIAGLTRTFSAHDPRLVTLFVVCAVLSGMATVLPSAEAPNAPALVPEAPRASVTAPKRGFFRSLLSRLF